VLQPKVTSFSVSLCKTLNNVASYQRLRHQAFSVVFRAAYLAYPVHKVCIGILSEKDGNENDQFSSRLVFLGHRWNYTGRGMFSNLPRAELVT